MVDSWAEQMAEHWGENLAVQTAERTALMLVVTMAGLKVPQ